MTDFGWELLLNRTRLTPSGCMEWSGNIGKNGYARYGKPKRLVHRLVWERSHGRIPDGLTVDHLCRNRACVNVAHLEVVTLTENVLRGEGPTAQNARKTHCIRGHLLAGDNVSYRPTGYRRCVTCSREQALIYARTHRKALA